MKVNACYVPLLQNENRYLVLKGGAGSGKSVFIAQKLFLRLISEEGHRFLVIRKVARTIKKSVFQLFLDIFSQHNIRERFKINLTELTITDTITGSTILFSGMDDQEKLKSIQGITGVWVEEATELEETDFLQLDLRLRGETQHYKQIALTFNPIDENHWIKTRFFDTFSSDISTLHTTFKDNAFLDKQYKRMLLTQMLTNENWYRIYVKGEWGKPFTGGEFYKNFKLSKQVRDLEYNPDLALHISLDFNVNPYITMTVWQVEDKAAYQIDEICLTTPRNKTEALAKEFERKYYAHAAGLFIYGDPSGRAEDTRTESGSNDFTLVYNALSRFYPILRVPKKAPPVAMRGNFINTVFDSHFQGIEVYINTACINTINDYTYVKQASDGTKHKKKIINPETKVPYEQYGHTSDANDYFLCECFYNEFQAYQKGLAKPEYKLGFKEMSKATRW